MLRKRFVIIDRISLSRLVAEGEISASDHHELTSRLYLNHGKRKAARLSWYVSSAEVEHRWGNTKLGIDHGADSLLHCCTSWEMHVRPW